jgi:NitT/TauT family transport system permease protein/putative hydroxymethylpyrimidine transport system permease protein
MTSARRILLPAAIVALLLGAWELYVDLGGADPLLLPSPHAVASALYNDRGALWSNFTVTAKEIVLGIAVAVVSGFVLSVAIHLSATLRRALLPLLVASQAVPVVIIAPLFLLWLGFGILPKLLVIGLVAFFPVVITTLAAMETVDPELLKLMRTFDASRRQTLGRVELPAALPGLFTGAKLAAVFTPIAAVLAEQAGSTSGLGYLLTVTESQLLAPEAFAAVTVLSGFAIVLFIVLSVAERRALPWAYQAKGESA